MKRKLSLRRAGTSERHTLTDVIPEYVTRDRQRLLAFADAHLGFLGATRRNLVRRAIETPKNGLFNALLPHLYDETLRSYICLADTYKLKLKNQACTEWLVCNPEIGPDLYQQDYPFFCNPLRFADYVGDGDRERPLYAGTPPNERVVNGRVYVHTVEFDPVSKDDPAIVKAFLSEQFGWCLSRGKKETDSILGDIYRELAAFHDFRGLEFVWSGNKSCHLHALFDLAHLASSRFAGSSELSADPRLPDVPDEALRAGLSSVWSKLVEIVARHTSVTIDADTHLKNPEQFRRTPWGQRSASQGNVLGIPEGEKIPQIVLWSKMRAAPRRSERLWFNHPAAFVEAQRTHRTSRPRLRPTRALPDTMREDFLQHLAGLCLTMWGNPTDHPRPAMIEDSPDGVRIKFFNNAADQQPGSVMDGDRNRLLIHSRTPEVSRRSYMLPLTANQLVGFFAEHGHLSLKKVSQQRSRWMENAFLEMLEGTFDPCNGMPGFAGKLPAIPPDSDAAQKLLGKLITQAGDATRLNVILSQEGVGKSTAFLDYLVTETNPREGYLAFATISYDQAEQKCAEFNERFAGRGYCGHVLRSFQHYYDRLAGLKPLSVRDVARLGYGNLSEAVYACGGQIVDELERVKDEFWGTIDASKAIPIFFTVHGVVQEWYRDRGTRMWAHPRFREFTDEKRANRDASRHGQVEDFDPDTLGRKLYDDLHIQRVIYDEVSMDALWWRHPAEAVEWCRGLENHALEVMGKEWSGLTLADKLDMFDQYARAVSLPSSLMAEARDLNQRTDSFFRAAREIIEIGYEDGDLKVVDTSLEPFGSMNTAKGSEFERINGARFYTKTKDWYHHNKYHLTMLTTERRVIAAMRSIRTADLATLARKAARSESSESSSASGRKQKRAGVAVTDTFHCYDFDFAHLFPQEKMQVDLRLDPRARTKVRSGKVNEVSKDGLRIEQPSDEMEMAKPDVRLLCEEIHRGLPEATIVSDGLKRVLPYVVTHAKGKGSNEFIGRSVIVAVFLHHGPAQYRDLLLENAHFGSRNAVRLFYVDQFNQTIGRVRGFRYRENSSIFAVMSPYVWRQVGHFLRAHARYDIRCE
jgi:hypothetical protein